MPDRLVGRPMRRREDPALLTGAATYTDDLAVEGMAHLAV
ncbi:MAG: xanthine dehydrogenase family protein molybdopterin-binding subunit, partial [Actinobacteria bacterium]|nr:xanthine dehydrogenase family protein molybdopterin-binding subunit [Actinomycetota bacterium]NIW31926.1 xanthine dehydrogenase family protein molybdopterin-binding subunit [Actinomycetota bacterium]NIX24189.1 xanthine dehydrogenase family protein molybdopterin-binding subunit [Actinomycetota bacterium]